MQRKTSTESKVGHVAKRLINYRTCYNRHVFRKRTGCVKQAILATVVSVKNQSSDCVSVRLQSDELNDATAIISTGLNCERTRVRRPGCHLDVDCNGDPKAEVGDTVAMVVESRPGH